MPMSKKMLDYMKREVVTAIDLMSQKDSSVHVFNYGNTPDGKEWVMLMAILPQDEAKP